MKRISHIKIIKHLEVLQLVQRVIMNFEDCEGRLDKESTTHSTQHGEETCQQQRYHGQSATWTREAGRIRTKYAAGALGFIGNLTGASPGKTCCNTSLCSSTTLNISKQDTIVCVKDSTTSHIKTTSNNIILTKRGQVPSDDSNKSSDDGE